MTIDKSAKEYASGIECCGLNRSDIEAAFESGCNWMIEKAVDFMNRHDGKMIVCNTEDEKDNFIMEFRKFMEK